MTTTTEPRHHIDLYESAEARTPTGSLTLEALIDGIRSDEYRPQVERLRAMLELNDQDGYAKAKRLLPAVSISGEVTKGARKAAISEGRFQHSGWLQLDFDGKDNIGWSVEEIREILQADPRVVAAFRSPSGDGVKAVARIPLCQTQEQHKAAFIMAEEHFAKGNLVIDAACKDPGRLCFVSWDPEAWIDLSRTAMFDPGDVPTESQPLLKPVHSKAPSDGRLILRDKHGPFPEPPHSGIHTWLMQAAWWCRLNDMTEHDTVERLRAYDGSLRRRLQPTEAVDAARAVFSAQLTNQDWKIEQQVAAMTTPPAGSTGKSFAPEDVFYDAPSGKYLIRQGNGYAIHSKRGPVVTGITRHIAATGQHESAKELTVAVKAAIDDREIDGAVQWSGIIAGHRQGIMLDNNGQQILITAEPQLPQPVAGEMPLIGNLLAQAFPNETAQEVFMAWLSGRYNSIRGYTHIASPMMVLAGEVNSGKSLISWIVAQLFGGRVANPYEAWSGGILWNDDLVGSEFLLIDDCTGHTDIRARRAFGAAFKGAIYPQMIQLRKRHSSSISVRPVWCCMLCCNDTPEALQIIPPLDPDVSDKISILHVHRVELPIDTSTPDGKKLLQTAIRQELPALADRLIDWKIPAHLHDSRAGVIAWRDPELVDWVDSHSPARRIEELIESAIEDHNIWTDPLPKQYTAFDIEKKLRDRHSSVRDQAAAMFTWGGACGSALSRLAKMNRGLVSLGEYDTVKNVNTYIIRRR